ncbi:MAG: 5-(carboxyamino)imidazole ribonucleotide mutase [Spirochaetales bacterium]|jgi:phosphoribosylaminoimidazole carboxylase PurE protein|nr:5-(carboxyamino)imidazole ribonucleotide mutase [Spirochaetales bacterium]
MKKIVIIMGSDSDQPHANKIIEGLEKCDGYAPSSFLLEVFAASAHREPRKVLEILDRYKDHHALVFITIAGRSNALSGFCAANTRQPVIACPPFADQVDMLVNINSTLQMPSNTPVLTVIDPGNAALAAVRILSLADCSGSSRKES